jgi:hypothetical protein
MTNTKRHQSELDRVQTKYHEEDRDPCTTEKAEETISMTLDRLLGELSATALMVDDLRGKSFSEGEAKAEAKDIESNCLQSQACRAAAKATEINRRLKSILARL